MQRYKHYTDYPPREDEGGEWVRYEDMQKVIRTLFDAKTLSDWMGAMAALGNFRGDGK